MNPLEGLDPDELVALSDVGFQEKVKKHARAKTAEAFDVISDVMHNSDDDQARLIAAGKYLHIAKVEDEKAMATPIGVSEEVMRIALVGLGQLVSIARDTTVTAHLRDVTPARADPRPFIADDSPLNAMPKDEKGRPLNAYPRDVEGVDDPGGRLAEEGYEVPGADLIKENVNVIEEE